MDLYAIAESKLAHELETEYKKAWTAKFKTTPLIQQSDQEVFRWLTTNFDEAQARRIVQKYVLVPSKYLQQNAYPPKLIRTSINEILAFVGPAEKSGTTNKEVRIRVQFSCSTCKEEFYWVGLAHELDTADITCTKCGQTDGKLRLPSDKGWA